MRTNWRLFFIWLKILLENKLNQEYFKTATSLGKQMNNHASICEELIRIYLQLLNAIMTKDSVPIK